MRTDPRRTAKSRRRPSDRGFLELAGRDDSISLREAFIRFRDLVSSDMDWADLRKARFRTRASCAKVAALALTAASTVVLGIPTPAALRCHQRWAAALPYRLAAS